MNAFKICFVNSQYDYITSFNGSYAEAQNYFLNKWLNLGRVADNMQKVKDVIPVFDLQEWNDLNKDYKSIIDGVYYVLTLNNKNETVLTPCEVV